MQVSIDTSVYGKREVLLQMEMKIFISTTVKGRAMYDLHFNYK